MVQVFLGPVTTLIGKCSNSWILKPLEIAKYRDIDVLHRRVEIYRPIHIGGQVESICLSHIP